MVLISRGSDGLSGPEQYPVGGFITLFDVQEVENKKVVITTKVKVLPTRLLAN